MEDELCSLGVPEDVLCAALYAGVQTGRAQFRGFAISIMGVFSFSPLSVDSIKHLITSRAKLCDSDHFDVANRFEHV